MFADGEEMPIARDDVSRTSFERSCEVLVVVGVVAYARDASRIRDDIGQHGQVLEPNPRVDCAEMLPHLAVGERAQHFVHDGWRDYELEPRVAQELLDETAWRARRLDDGADVHIRVEDGANQWLLGLAASFPRPLPRGALCLEREFEGLLLGDRGTAPLIEEFQRMPSRVSTHLLEALNRHKRGERLALTLDDKLIVPESHAVEQVADPLAHLDRGYLLHL
jgi:hypothetical protein